MLNPKLAYAIQFIGTVFTTGAAAYLATENGSILPALIAAVGAAVAMAQKSMNDPRRTLPHK